jgi:hypothetical protein
MSSIDSRQRCQSKCRREAIRALTEIWCSKTKLEYSIRTQITTHSPSHTHSEIERESEREVREVSSERAIVIRASEREIRAVGCSWSVPWPHKLTLSCKFREEYANTRSVPRRSDLASTSLKICGQ